MNRLARRLLFAMTTLLFAAARLFGEEFAAIARQLPPKGIGISEADRRGLQDAVHEFSAHFEEWRKRSPAPEFDALSPDVEVAALAAVGDWLQFPFALYMWLLLAVTAWTIGRRLLLAIAKPEPPRVQAAVKSCLMSYILIHAATVCGFLGPWWALSVIALLIPPLLLGRWVYAT